MQETLPFLVYRDRVGVPSEISFLRRQYVGFTRLQPIWTGRVLLPAAPAVGSWTLRLGGEGLLGGTRRLLFRHFGWVPQLGLPDSPTLACARLEAPTLDDGASVQIGRGGNTSPSLAPVLHAQFARGGALALPLARALRLRVVVTLHGGDISKQKNWRGTLLARRWPALLREAACFVCVSNAVAEVAAARGVPAAKLAVLPIGVEVAEQPPATSPLTAHLFVGRFVEKKGVAILADAMRHLRSAGDQTPLVCVGDGPLRPLLEILAREVPGVSLTGWLDPAAIRPRMAAAYSLVVPSVVASDGDAEGLPSVVPEAMAQACPVIGSDQGGIAEAVRHDLTGLLVPPGDARALAAAMHRITREPGLRLVLGSAGFNAAASTLNARIQSRKLETLLLST